MEANERTQAMSNSGIDLIAAERKRQVGVEGWSREHDDDRECGVAVDPQAWTAFFDPLASGPAPSVAPSSSWPNLCLR